jgi:phosphopantetheinyl transferase (holo-ACP synthase)
MKIGVDLIEIERIRHTLERHGDDFKERCFTEGERMYCDSKPNPAQHCAVGGEGGRSEDRAFHDALA